MRTLLPFAFLLAASLSAQGIFERQADIGSPSQAGSARFASGAYEITGGGANIWGTADAFHFLFKPASGGLALTAHVRFEGEGKAAHRKTGWMIRQSLDANSAWAGVMVHGDGLTSLQYRATAGGPTQEVRASITAPAVIRLVRKGDTFTLFAARAGESLTEAASIRLALQDPVYAGLAICSHDDTVVEKAVFTEVEWSR